MLYTVVKFVSLLCYYAAAVNITINNPSFENDFYPVPQNTFYYDLSQTLTGWLHYDPSYCMDSSSAGVQNPTGGTSFNDPTHGDSSPDGIQNLYLEPQETKGANGEGDGAFGVEQVLTGELVTADTIYTLSGYVGNPDDNQWSSDSTDGSIITTDRYMGFPGYKMMLLTDEDTILVQDDNILAPSLGQWAYSISQVNISAADPNIGKTLKIRLVNKNAAKWTGIQVNFDGIQLTAESTLTSDPTSDPTRYPSEAPSPTVEPSVSPSELTLDPSTSPSIQTLDPTKTPSNNPSIAPSNTPTAPPSSPPTRVPSNSPTKPPSNPPTDSPIFVARTSMPPIEETVVTTVYFVKIEVCEYESIENCEFEEDDITSSVKESLSEFVVTVSNVQIIDDTIMMDVAVKTDADNILSERDLDDEITAIIKSTYNDVDIEVSRYGDEEEEGQDLTTDINDVTLALIIGITMIAGLMFLLCCCGCLWFFKRQQMKMNTLELEVMNSINKNIGKSEKEAKNVIPGAKTPSQEDDQQMHQEKVIIGSREQLRITDEGLSGDGQRSNEVSEIPKTEAHVDDDDDDILPVVNQTADEIKVSLR